MSDAKQKTCILVTGMHRSGTSATAGLLNILGVDLGKNLICKNDYNTKGYFENKIVTEANQQILKILGSDGYTDEILPADWVKNSLIDQYRKIIEAEILNNISKHDVFGLKDPHLCLTLPLIMQILANNKIYPKILICHRDNLEIAQSLQKRDGVSLETALKLCDKYKNYINYYINEYKFDYIDIYYDELLLNTEKVVSQIEKFIAILPRTYEMARDEINHFLENKLKHYNSPITHHFIKENIRTAKELEKIRLKNILLILEQQNIKESLSWKILIKIQKMIDKIFSYFPCLNKYYKKLIRFLRKIFISRKKS